MRSPISPVRRATACDNRPYNPTQASANAHAHEDVERPRELAPHVVFALATRVGYERLVVGHPFAGHPFAGLGS